MHYNNAKAALIYDIYERIFAADPTAAHDPHPRPGQAVDTDPSGTAYGAQAGSTE